MNDWNTGTPAAAGDYNASSCGDPDMRRHWCAETGWSGCWSVDAPPENIARSRAAAADRDNLRGMKWCEVPVTVE